MTRAYRSARHFDAGPERPRVILFLVNDADFFISHRLNLALAARDTGYRVVIACPTSDNASAFDKAGLEYIQTSKVRGRNGLLSQLATLVSYRKIIRDVQPDLVHLVTSKPVILGGILARLGRIPSISAISGLGYVFTAQGGRVRVLRALICLGYAFALNHKNSIVIFQNEVDRTLFAKLRLTSRARTMIVKGSGVDLAGITVHDVPAGPPVVLLPARLLRDKGVEEFVEAARIVKIDHPTVIFRLQGKLDPQNPSSVSAVDVARWTSEGVIEHAPYSNNPDRMFSKASIVALPSYREGFPKSLVDAAAAGRAVVTTDVPGCRDAIIPGVTGLLVKVRDAEALAAAISRLLDDAELRASMALAGRRLAEEVFDIRTITQQHLALYAEALKLGDRA